MITAAALTTTNNNMINTSIYCLSCMYYMPDTVLMNSH